MMAKTGEVKGLFYSEELGCGFVRAVKMLEHHFEPEPWYNKIGKELESADRFARDVVKDYLVIQGIKDSDLSNMQWYIEPLELKLDGKSAGLALAIAFLSCKLKIPIPSNLAITGEIDPEGKIIPVDEINKKLESAYHYHNTEIHQVIIPNANEEAEQKFEQKGFEIIPVNTFKETVYYIFGDIDDAIERDKRGQTNRPKLSIWRDIEKKEFLVGETVQVSVIIKNKGGEPAYNVEFEERIPPGLELISGDVGYGGIIGRQNFKKLTYIVKTVEEGRVCLPAQKIGYQNIKGRYYDDSFIPKDTILVETPKVAKLKIARAIPKGMLLGKKYDVEVLIQNLGNEPVKDIVFKDTLPPIFRLVGGETRWSGRLEPKEKHKIKHTIIPIKVGTFTFEEESVKYKDKAGRVKKCLVDSYINVVLFEDCIEFINQRNKLRNVRNHLNLTGIKGEKQIVLIEGSAGVGKTRFVEELKRTAKELNFKILSGECHEKRGNGVADMFKKYLGVTDELLANNIDKEEIDEIFRNRTGKELKRCYLEILMHIITNGKYQTNFKIKENPFAIEYILSQIKNVHPIFLFFDDIHWADEITLSVIENLISSEEIRGMFLCATFRAENIFWEERFKEWMEQTEFKEKCSEYRLEPLQSDDVYEMVDLLLAPERISDHSKRIIDQITEGIPFYVISVLRGLIQSKAIERKYRQLEINAEIDIKKEGYNAVKKIIRKELDIIKNEELEILKYATIIGRDFDFKLLKKCIEDNTKITEEELAKGLQALIGRQLISQDDGKFRFKHCLTQEGVEEIVATEIEAEKYYRAVGITEESYYKNEIETKAPELARHFQKAGNDDKATHYLVIAGKQAEKMYALKDASEYFRDALEMIEKGEMSEKNLLRKIDTLFSLGNLERKIGNWDKAVVHFHECINLAKDKNHRRLGECYFAVGSVLRARGETTKAVDYFEKALKIMKKIENIDLILEAIHHIRDIYYRQGTPKKILSIHKRCINIFSKKGDLVAVGRLMADIAIMFKHLKDYDESMKKYQEVMKMAKKIKNSELKKVALYGMDLIRRAQGQWDKSLAYYKKYSLDEGNTLYDKYNKAWNLNRLAAIYRGMGNLKEAGRTVEKALKLAESIGDEFQIRIILGHSSLIFQDLKEWNKSLYYHRRHLKLSQRVESVGGQIFALRGIGEISVVKCDPESAKKCFERILRILKEKERLIKEDIGKKKDLADALYNIGNIYYLQGKLPSALKYTERAMEMVKELMPYEKVADIVGAEVPLLPLHSKIQNLLSQLEEKVF